MPATAFMVVLLPAPLRPSKANVSPFCNCRLSPNNTWLVSYSTSSWLTRNMSLMGMLHGFAQISFDDFGVMADFFGSALGQ